MKTFLKIDFHEMNDTQAEDLGHNDVLRSKLFRFCDFWYWYWLVLYFDTKRTKKISLQVSSKGMTSDCQCIMHINTFIAFSHCYYYEIEQIDALNYTQFLNSQLYF